ncbi:MAG: cell division protein ZapA [Clostridiales Family XIII bacterium]|jgi:cell division protein ZapA|nr:cell division protein ZapA [Clostridiales Family XIII bacterium]
MERAKVKIYGQEYTVSGDKTQEYIERVAAYVDERMRQMASLLPSGSVSELAALAALNIADELFSSWNVNDELKGRSEQMENDTQHYIQLWEEAKRSFLQYKDEAQHTLNEKSELQKKYDEIFNESERLKENQSNLESRLADAERHRDSLAASLNAHEEGRHDSAELIRDLEYKNKELERSFFDLQMENTQAKSELERYKKLVEQ